MSHAFRELLKKIGSGPHTGENLTRQEAAAAMQMMLLQEATPAQIGAFMIAHRIKRPTGAELAGMLDACDLLGPKLSPKNSEQSPVMVLGCPYDGRSRTAPISPLTALILVTAGQSVIIHGGERMPTKEGLPLIEVWQGLGVNWAALDWQQTEQVFHQTGLGFVYLPRHFPLAQGLVTYREQIGKRPPLATMELIFSPYSGKVHLVSGFVHPPTEIMFQEAFAWRGIPEYFTTVKGLEGSCDLPRDRTTIIGLGKLTEELNSEVKKYHFERLLLHPRDYDLAAKEVPLDSTAELLTKMQTVLRGETSELMSAAIWNGGFYLWRAGICQDVAAGIAKAENLLVSGKVAETLQAIQTAVSA